VDALYFRVSSERQTTERRELLTRRVEVDECYVGGLEEGLPGRLNLEKALVVVAAQEDGPGIGRIRMRQIIDASAESPCHLCRSQSSRVAPSTLTDGWATSPRRRKATSTNPNYGYNAATDQYEDLVKSGVIDPTKVTRTALQNASSIASLMLTTEAMVAEIPEKKSAPAAGGHGPEGMDY